MSTRATWAAAATTVACAALLGCDADQKPGAGGEVRESPAPVERSRVTESTTEQPGHVQAKAELKAAEGQKIEGEVELHDTGRGVRIVARIQDAVPGKHGFHVHAEGDCSDIPGQSMGEHFDPKGEPHALPHEGPRHLGDLGNLEVKPNGEGQFEITVENANLKPNDPNSFLGRAIVVHMTEDTGKAKQPHGGSGPPVACGVIEKA